MFVPTIKDIQENNEAKVNVEFNVDKFDMSVYELTDIEELTPKNIKYIEGLVRKSYEYRKFVGYLKNELDITQCSFMKGIDISEIQVSLEFHHFPYTLYEVVNTVGNMMLDDEEETKSVSYFDIADKVIEEHYRNRIGLIPLTKTVHEMAHSRAIQIPLSKAYGDHSNFTDSYEKYISDEGKHAYSIAKTLDSSLDVVANNSEKIKKKIITYELTYE